MPQSSLSNSKTASEPSNNAHLTAWMRELENRPRSLNPHISNEVAHLLHEDDCTSDKLAKLIKQDPVLCLQLFEYAEQMLKGREGEVQHIVHLVSLIGLNAVEHQVRESSKNPALNKQAGFQEIIAASIFAAHISASLLTDRHHANSERFFMSALLFNAPFWLMWGTSPKIMSRCQVLASRLQQRYPALSIKKLGFSIPDLLSQSGSFIHLPVMTQKALMINPQKNIHLWAKALRYDDRALAQWFREDKTSRMFFNSVEMGIYLINQYVLAIYFDFNGKHIRRYSQLLGLHLRIDTDQLKEQCLNLASSVSLPNSIPQSATPLYRMRQLHRQPPEDQQKKPSSKTNNAAVSNTQSKPLKDAESSTLPINQYIRDIRSSHSIESAFNATLLACSKGIGTDHCLIMNVAQQAIKTQLCDGFTSDSAIMSLSCERNQQNNLFDQLTRKPACLSIAASDIDKASRKMPAAFVEALTLQPCAFLSIFQHQQAKAIIYCDHSQWDRQKQHQLKLIGKHLTQALERLYKR